VTNSGTLTVLAQGKALATEYTATAYEVYAYGVSQDASNSSSASITQTVTNSGTMNVTARGTAQANGTSEPASVEYVSAIGVSQYASSGGAIAQTVTNSGSLTVLAQGKANAASSNGTVYEISAQGVYQYASASGSVSQAVTNSGTFAVSALGTATGTQASASYLSAIGVSQYASSGGAIAQTVTNSGTFSVLAQGKANASTGYGTVSEISALGVYQSAGSGGAITQTVTNSGTLAVSALGTATGTGAYVDYLSATGIEQSAGSDSAITQTVTNSGTLTVLAQAKALGTTYSAEAYEVSAHGIGQFAGAGGDVHQAVTNSGRLTVSALATATGTSATASSASAVGIYQIAGGGGEISQTVTNSGSLTVLASVKALGTSYDADASDATAIGIGQTASGTYDHTITQSVTNTGAISVSALAKATGTSASASSASATGIRQGAFTGGDTSQTVTNSGTLTVLAQAQALATGSSEASATEVYAYGVEQGAGSYFSGFVSQTISQAITNSGTIAVTARATATGSSAYADYVEAIGIGQFVEAYNPSGTVTQSVTNSGSLAVLAQAKAHATNTSEYASASASATGILQRVYFAGSVSQAVTNTGSVSVTAKADATGGYSGQATASASGIYQLAYNIVDTVSQTVTNSGTLAVSATANAEAGDYYVNAEAYATGIDQYGNTSGSVSERITNSGTLSVHAIAKAIGNASVSYATATASAYGIFQDGQAETAALHLTNSGQISVAADATAQNSYTEYGYAYASAWGVEQVAYGAGGVATIDMTNSGRLTVAANASMSGNYELYAEATAVGVYQDVAVAGHYTAPTSGAAYVPGETAHVSLTNSGTISVAAAAHANGLTSTATASAYAYAGGVRQYANGSSDNEVNLTNSGSITVAALAHALGGSDTSASASATAYGVYGSSGNAETLNVTYANSGRITVSAEASAAAGTSANAYAYAVGIELNAGDIEGTLTNSGSINVSATVKAAADSASAYASAVGILMDSAVNNATVTNTGTIIVTNNGGDNATGILIAGGSRVPSAPTVLFTRSSVDLATIINDGGVISAGLTSGPVTSASVYTHGEAINTRLAPNAVNINLKGNTTAGYIYGDIVTSDVDVITVSNGITKFDGHINDVTNLIGTLNIASTGTLYLYNNNHNGQVFGGAARTYDGAAGGYVDDLTIAGTLSVDLPNTPSTSSAGTPGNYSQISANTANITGGKLIVRADSYNGLYGNNYEFQNVIDANTLTGHFASVALDTTSPLLTLAATYDAYNNVDIAVARVHFDAVSGLTKNRLGVAGAIEDVYSPTLGLGGFHSMIGDLFAHTNATTYQSAMNQMGGSEYAGYLQSLRGAANLFNGLVDDQMARKETNTVWGRISYGTEAQDGDLEAPAYSADQYAMTIGGDHAFNNKVIGGAAIAAIGNKVKFDNGVDLRNARGANIDTTGYQFGLYGQYDAKTWYARGLTSYADLNGDSTRHIAIAADTNGSVRASTKASVFSVTGETGMRYEVGGAEVSPFVSLTYTGAKLRGFTEHGMDGINLAVAGSDDNRWVSALGGRITGEVGKLQSQLGLSWEHDFGDDYAQYAAAFNGVSGSNFSQISALRGAETGVVDVNVNGKLAKDFDLKLSYKGKFNSDYQTNLVSLKLSYTLGGK